MAITPLTFLIVCPMLFAAGFIDAIGGDGGLISIPAYLFAGLPPHAAVATNKLSSSMGTTVATIRLCRSGYARNISHNCIYGFAGLNIRTAIFIVLVLLAVKIFLPVISRKSL